MGEMAIYQSQSLINIDSPLGDESLRYAKFPAIRISCWLMLLSNLMKNAIYLMKHALSRLS